MQHTRSVGLDVHKDQISVALAKSGRGGAAEYPGQIANNPAAISKLCAGLAWPGATLSFCYEADPCGYGLHRQLTGLGHCCQVVAPCLIHIKPGDRVKTDRRAATLLARLRRAGELTCVWVPDEAREAMRDLIRLRSTVRQVVTRAHQHLQGFLLRHGRSPEQKRAWGVAYRRWLLTLAFDHPAQQIAFQDYVDGVSDAIGTKRLVSNFIARCKCSIQNRYGAGPLRRRWAVSRSGSPRHGCLFLLQRSH
jgi:transposase